MSSRKSVNVTGVVQKISFHRQTSALVTYKIKDITSGKMLDLVCLRYRCEDREDFSRTHSNINFGDVVEASGFLRTRTNGEKFISVKLLTKVDTLKCCIPSIPLTIYYDRFVYQGVVCKYSSVNLSGAGHMVITSDEEDLTIDISEQGFEHTSFFIKSNKYENMSYDMMERIPYSVIAGVIAGPFPEMGPNNNFPIIPLKINPFDVVYQGKTFKYSNIEMNGGNRLTLKLKDGPKIEIVRQGPGHAGFVVYKNEHEKFEGEAYDLMLEVNYDTIASSFI